MPPELGSEGPEEAESPGQGVPWASNDPGESQSDTEVKAPRPAAGRPHQAATEHGLCRLVPPHSTSQARKDSISYSYSAESDM